MSDQFLRNQTKVQALITQEQKNLLELLGRVRFGEIKIIIQQGQPLRVEYAMKIIKLDSQPDFNKDLEVIAMDEL